MFHKTRRHLTLLNSVVFLLILLVFGGTMFTYVATKLFDKVDDSMLRRIESFRLVNGRMAPIARQARPHFDPRVFLLLKDGQGNIVNLYPNSNEAMMEVEQFLLEVEKKGRHYDKADTQKVDEHYYRMLSRPYVGVDNRLIRHDGLTEHRIVEVIAISIVDSEISLLRNFSQVIIVGLILSMLAAISAAYYLARRALIPIMAAWDNQSQFVGDASHELRTPLAVIKSNAELLLRHPTHTIEDESVRITNIVRESSRMSRLVSTLLTLARADANQTEVSFASVKLHELIGDIAGQFVPLAELKKIELMVAQADEIELLADRERLQQLIVIVLDNALKFTPEGGSIALSCIRQNGWAVLVIEDTGQGIEADDLSRIFDRFYRGDKVRSREHGGAGLGLAIAKWIVERHGGKVKVDSKPGEGSKFQFSLPLARK